MHAEPTPTQALEYFFSRKRSENSGESYKKYISEEADRIAKLMQERRDLPPNEKPAISDGRVELTVPSCLSSQEYAARLVAVQREFALIMAEKWRDIQGTE